MAGRSFAAAERFASQVAAGKFAPAYVLIGDETFLLRIVRRALVGRLGQGEQRDFGFHDFDLAETSLASVLDSARHSSLIPPFHVFFVRGVKELYKIGRASCRERV